MAENNNLINTSSTNTTSSTSSSPVVEWEEREHFWISPNAQGTDEWLADRVGRITMSKLGATVGHCPYNKSIKKTARLIAGLEKEVFSDFSIGIMAHGTRTEPLAREWYENKHNYTVVEHGLAVPKWNIHLGASVDGDVIGTDGIIEIKAPKRLYRDLDEYTEKMNHGWVPPEHYHDHLKSIHYDQMQGCMAVFKKSWCDYIVFCTPEDRVFTQRVAFNPGYWNNELYPKVQRFIEHELKPLLTKPPNLPQNYVLHEYQGF